jgi:CBS domain-containing protein
LKVEDVGTMGNNVITIKQSDTIARAAQLMMEHNIRHLVVIDDENKLVGVISVRDIIKTNKILKAISEAH